MSKCQHITLFKVRILRIPEGICCDRPYLKVNTVLFRQLALRTVVLSASQHYCSSKFACWGMRFSVREGIFWVQKKTCMLYSKVSLSLNLKISSSALGKLLLIIWLLSFVSKTNKVNNVCNLPPIYCQGLCNHYMFLLLYMLCLHLPLQLSMCLLCNCKLVCIYRRAT